MADLALSLHDLPPDIVHEILAVLQNYTPVGAGEAEAGVVLFQLKGTAVGEITVKSDEQNLQAKVTALDSEGHETTFDATPTWESSDTTVADVTPSADGYEATFTIGDPGSAVITVTRIENSSGEDVEILSVGTITVTAGDAVVGSVEFSIPPSP